MGSELESDKANAVDFMLKRLDMNYPIRLRQLNESKLSSCEDDVTTRTTTDHTSPGGAFLFFMFLFSVLKGLEEHALSLKERRDRSNRTHMNDFNINNSDNCYRRNLEKETKKDTK